MPLGQSQDIPQTDPRGMATPRFWHRLIRFRHVISGSLALASLNHTCRNLVPTFPQRSPPSLLTTAACGGLRSTPDCRPRRTYLHLSYSYAPPCGPALLVTQCQFRTHALQKPSPIHLPNLHPTQMILSPHYRIVGLRLVSVAKCRLAQENKAFYASGCLLFYLTCTCVLWHTNA